MSKQVEVVLGGNFYQPLRQADHYRLKGINPDPQGINWTIVVDGECYRPLKDKGVLARVTYNYFGTLDHDLERIDPATSKVMRFFLRDNGVADTYIHALLPDVSREDKEILVKAGRDRFESITGSRPRFIWLPEGAINTETLEVLAEYGVEGFFCSPEQVILRDGGDANNTPTRVWLSGGRNILAIPFDREFSRKIAFEEDASDPLRADAYKFTDRVVQPALSKFKNGFPLLGYTDAETFGHHMQWGGDFVDALVNRALPERGINVVTINKVDFSRVTIAEGKIKERSAWSCPHGDLARWHGGWECDCCGWDVGWKREFYHSVHSFNGSITEVVRKEFGNDYLKKMRVNFEAAFNNSGENSSTELSLESSKVSALKAVTSCVTFFGDPGVSGNINILSAREAIEHLKDAGLVREASRIWSNFLNNMNRTINPVNGRNGTEMTRDLLGDIALENYAPMAA